MAAPVAVPLTVIVYVPGAVLDAAVIERADEVEVPGMLVGFAVTVRPAGAPEVASATAPVKPPVRVTLTVADPAAAPCVTLTEAGVTLIVYAPVATAVTVSATEAV